MRKVIFNIIFINIFSITALNAASQLGLIGIEKDKTFNATEYIEQTNTYKNIKNSKPITSINNKLNEIKKEKNNFFNNLNKFTEDWNTPIKVSKPKPTKVVEGSVSWSLVNDKCQVDPNAVFQTAIKNMVEKYKKIWDQLKNKEIWKMYAVNKGIELVVSTYALKECTTKLFKAYSDKKELYNAEFQSCLQDKMKGTFKNSTGSTTGTSNTANVENQFDLKSAAFMAYYSYTCQKTTMQKVFGSKYDKCMEDTTTRLLGWINGKIDLTMKMELSQFKIEQQACILKKYNMELSMQDILMDAFDLKGKDTDKGSTLVVTNKNTAANNPIEQANISYNVVNNTLKTENLERKNQIEKLSNILSKSEPNENTTNIKIKAYKIYYIYNKMYINWVTDIFGMSQIPVNIIVKDSNGNEIVNGKTFKDRWQMPIYFGMTREKIFKDPLYSDQKSKLVTPNIVSTAEECTNLVNNPNINALNPEAFLFYDNSDLAKNKDDLIKLNEIKGDIFNTKAKNYSSFIQYYYFLIKSKNSSEIAKQMNNISENIYKLSLYNNKYMNYLYTMKMLVNCYNWAFKNLNNIIKNEAVIIRKYALSASIANGSKVSKEQRQIVLDLQQSLRNYLQSLKDYLKQIVNPGVANLIYQYSERVKEIENTKEKSKELKIY